MNVNDLIRALGDIDEKYIVEKYEPIKKRAVQKNNIRKVNFRKREVITMNKKVLGIAAIAVLAIVVTNVGIISQKKGNTDTTLSSLVEISNPLTEVNSASEMKSYLGFDVPMLDKEVDSYIVIGDGKYADHARVIYKDGTRLEMEKGTGDVSGIYRASKEKEETIANVKVTFYNYENIKYANWTKDGFTYSYQNENGEVNKEEIQKLINK